MSLNDWLDRRVFELVHRHNLVYNTCWEDPRLDRAALGSVPKTRCSWSRPPGATCSTTP